MSKYCKTAKGHQEISERAAGLGLRARRLLILIDGQRDSEELARLAGDIDPTLAATPAWMKLQVKMMLGTGAARTLGRVSALLRGGRAAPGTPARAKSTP